MTDIVHALCLNLHQPADNLAALGREHKAGRSADGVEILGCYQRIADHVGKYASVARVHLAVSASLLQQWRDPAVAGLWRDVVDPAGLIAALREANSVELIGGGMSRPDFARIPPSDWDAQLAAERALFTEILGRAPKGFRAVGDRVPTGLVAALARAGYAYLVLPASALRNAADGAPVDCFQPYRLVEGKHSIAAIAIDEDMSRAQAHGLDPAWFVDEVRARVGDGELRLVTTWSDGENGPWFRAAEGNFFESFFSPAMEFCETGEYPLRPVFLSEILERYGLLTEAVIADAHRAARAPDPLDAPSPMPPAETEIRESKAPEIKRTETKPAAAKTPAKKTARRRPKTGRTKPRAPGRG